MHVVAVAVRMLQSGRYKSDCVGYLQRLSGTAAFNTIDAVRAMRDISATVSARWMAVGYSQGGQAVWAANELNSYYGNDLQLQGSVALAPAANLT